MIFAHLFFLLSSAGEVVQVGGQTVTWPDMLVSWSDAHFPDELIAVADVLVTHMHIVNEDNYKMTVKG